MTIEQVAQVAHEVNKAYCSAIGDDTQVEWDVAPSEREYGSVQGANIPGIMSGIGGIAAPKKDIREVTKAKDKEAEAEAKR